MTVSLQFTLILFLLSVIADISWPDKHCRRQSYVRSWCFSYTYTTTQAILHPVHGAWVLRVFLLESLVVTPTTSLSTSPTTRNVC